LINWKPNYEEFQELFSNENALRILALLSQEKQQYCAADIAKLLDIHISTSKKYLDLFYTHSLIEKEEFANKPGKPTYYYPKSDQITISLDMSAIAHSLTESLDKDMLPNPLIRERPNIESGTTYDIDRKGLVREITVKKRTKAKRFVKQKLKLSTTEGQFMKYLPHPTMEFNPFLQICSRAKIINYFEIKSLFSFIRKLENLGTIELKEAHKAS
jgi:predicted transcriptional regulator